MQRILLGRSSPHRFFSTLPYIPSKLKQDIHALHVEDPSRWTATTLAARFNCPHSNVVALLHLRGRRPPALNDIPEKLEQAWGGIVEFRGGLGGGGGRWRETDVQKEEEVVPVAMEERDGEKKEGDGGTVEEEVVEVRKSVTAEWIEKLCEGAALDVQRRTTFAFIEVGEGEGEGERAVWLREGGTGKLRVAEEGEREVLLGQVRTCDAKVWK